MQTPIQRKASIGQPVMPLQYSGRKGPNSVTHFRPSRWRSSPAALTVALVAAVSPIPSMAIAADKLQAVVTVKPLHSLLVRVLGDDGTASVLVDGASSPHTFALKPSQAQALAKADLIVRVGDELETFMTRVVRALPARVTVVNVARLQGLTLHPIRGGGEFEAHRDDDEHRHGKARGRAKHDGHDDHAKEEVHAKGGIDPHLWLDPTNAVVIVRHLAEVVARLRPEAAAAARERAARTIAELNALDIELKERLAPMAGRPFIVFHDAYQYFEARYGVHAAGSVTVSVDHQPSAKRIEALRARVREEKAACVFSEPQFRPRLVAVVTEKTSARSGVLDPLGAGSPAGVDHYPRLMRQLAASFIACLDPKSTPPPR